MMNNWNRYELAQLLEYFIHKDKERASLVIEKKVEDQLPVLIKVIRQLENNHKEIGLSMSDIVELGNLLECTSYKETALKNWVKREIKMFIGIPQVGKKYSVQQAALLFIVKDLKTILDFDAIRKVLSYVFNNPMDRSDDHLSPMDFFLTYSKMYEQLMKNEKVLTDAVVTDAVFQHVNKLTIPDDEKENVTKAFIVALLSTRATYIQGMAMQYVTE